MSKEMFSIVINEALSLERFILDIFSQEVK